MVKRGLSYLGYLLTSVPVTSFYVGQHDLTIHIKDELQ